MFPPNIRGSLLGTCAGAALMLGLSHGAHAQTQINGGGSTLAGPVYETLFGALSTQVDTTINFNYALVGSGAGARGVLCNDGSQVPVGGVSPSTVHYGASDNPLTTAQITNWDNNAAQSGCNVQNGGKALGGPLMQIPTIGTPITLAYNTVRQTANGGLTFTDAQLCGIFSGQITSWTDAALSGIATRNAPTGPITVVYRSDGSGTSAVFTAHLNAVCAAPPAYPISFTSTQTFATLFTSGGGHVPSNFIGASGSGNVAASIGLNAAINGTVTGTSGSIGYISPDYTQIAQIHTGGKYPPVAKVVNSTTLKAVLPDYNDTTSALAQAPLPTGAALQDGTQYVPTIANPTVGYPIVGYTTFILPTCYQDNNVVNGLYEFLSAIYTLPDYIGVIQQQGFVQLPAALVGLINANILNNNNGYNIDIDDANICQNNGVTGPGTYVGR